MPKPRKRPEKNRRSGARNSAPTRFAGLARAPKAGSFGAFAVSKDTPFSGRDRVPRRVEKVSEHGSRARPLWSGCSRSDAGRRTLPLAHPNRLFLPWLPRQGRDSSPLADGYLHPSSEQTGKLLPKFNGVIGPQIIALRGREGDQRLEVKAENNGSRIFRTRRGRHADLGD